MANFTTHIAVGTIVSGIASTLTLAANVISNESLVAVTMAGVVGSVLPDVDLKDSRPSRAMFAGLGICASFAVLFSLAGKLSIVELWVAWLGTLVGVRYGLHALFHRMAVHRGIWHSLLALAFCSLLTTIGFKYILSQPDGIAWLGGAFMGMGFFTHLVLDELYSVDVMDTRLKASFGTALKLFDVHHLGHSAAMAAGVAAAFAIAPPSGQFLHGITSPQLWANLKDELLPRERWFGLIEITHRATQVMGPAALPPPPRSPDTPAVSVMPAQVPPLAMQPQPTAVPSGAALTTGSLPPRSPFRTIAREASTGSAASAVGPGNP